VAKPALEIVAAFFDDPPAMVAQDVEFMPLTRELAFGRDAVVRALADIAEQFRDYEVRPAELIPAGEDTVIARLERTGVTHRSDMPITDTFAQVFTVRDGQIVRIESFKTLAEAWNAIPA